MSYTAFSSNSVFLDRDANIICNQLWTNLEAAADEVPITLETVFAISGSVSRIIQDDLALEPVKVIPFVTDSEAIFEIFAAKTPALFKVPYQQVDDTIQLIVQGFYIECHFVADVGTINTVDGLYCQDDADIPENIL